MCKRKCMEFSIVLTKLIVTRKRTTHHRSDELYCNFKFQSRLKIKCKTSLQKAVPLSSKRGSNTPLLYSFIFTPYEAHYAFRTPNSAFFYNSLIFSTILFFISFRIFALTLKEHTAKSITPKASVTQGLNTMLSIKGLSSGIKLRTI